MALRLRPTEKTSAPLRSKISTQRGVVRDVFLGFGLMATLTLQSCAPLDDSQADGVENAGDANRSDRAPTNDANPSDAGVDSNMLMDAMDSLLMEDVSSTENIADTSDVITALDADDSTSPDRPIPDDIDDSGTPIDADTSEVEPDVMGDDIAAVDSTTDIDGSTISDNAPTDMTVFADADVEERDTIDASDISLLDTSDVETDGGVSMDRGIDGTPLTDNGPDVAREDVGVEATTRDVIIATDDGASTDVMPDSTVCTAPLPVITDVAIPSGGQRPTIGRTYTIRGATTGEFIVHVKFSLIELPTTPTIEAASATFTPTNVATVRWANFSVDRDIPAAARQQSLRITFLPSPVVARSIVISEVIIRRSTGSTCYTTGTVMPLVINIVP